MFTSGKLRHATAEFANPVAVFTYWNCVVFKIAEMVNDPL